MQQGHIIPGIISRHKVAILSNLIRNVQRHLRIRNRGCRPIIATNTQLQDIQLGVMVRMCNNRRNKNVRQQVPVSKDSGWGADCHGRRLCGSLK